MKPELHCGDVCQVRLSYAAWVTTHNNSYFKNKNNIAQYIATGEYGGVLWLIPKGFNFNISSVKEMWQFSSLKLPPELDLSVQLQFDRWYISDFSVIKIIRNAPIGDFSFNEE